MRPSRGFCAARFSFRCSKSIMHTDILFMFDNLEYDILRQVVFSATLSRLLPLHIGFQDFQYIRLS